MEQTPCSTPPRLFHVTPFFTAPRKSTFTHESVRFFLVQTNGRSGSLVSCCPLVSGTIIVCTIEGTTTDTETKNLYLVESGADIRVKEEVSLFVSSTLRLLVSPSLRLFVSSTLRLLVSSSFSLLVF